MAIKNICFRMKSGQSMRSYCQENNIYYNNCYQLVDKGLTPDEAIEHYWKRKGKRGENNLKYKFKGVSLRKLLTNKQYNKVIRYMKRKSCKYEESIIGQIMSKEEFEKLYLSMLNVKFANGIRMSPQETKDYIAMTEPKPMTMKEYYEMKLKEIEEK